MQTTRLLPIIFLAACSLNIEGTEPRVPDSVDVPNATRPSDDGDAELQPCVHSSRDAGCTQVDPYDAGHDAAHDAGHDARAATIDPCASGLDSDGDARPDCQDDCPADPNKTEPLRCGCGMAEGDEDGDGTPNCIDECPQRADKTTAGVCGCEGNEADAASGKEQCENKAPTVVLVGPSSDAVQGAALSLRADAHDEDGMIRKVTLFVDGKAIREERTEPYIWGAGGQNPDEFAKLSVGVHVFMARVEDNRRASAEASLQLTIIVP